MTMFGKCFWHNIIPILLSKTKLFMNEEYIEDVETRYGICKDCQRKFMYGRKFDGEGWHELSPEKTTIIDAKIIVKNNKYYLTENPDQPPKNFKPPGSSGKVFPRPSDTNPPMKLY